MSPQKKTKPLEDVAKLKIETTKPQI